MEIAAQIISIAAMGVYLLSFQQKKQNAIIFFQLVANALFSLSFLMLGAMTGAILNLISAIRATLFIYKKQLKTDNNIWLVGFIAVYIASYAWSIFLLGDKLTPITAILELFPVVGMVATTLGYRAKTAKGTRISGLVNEPAWLVYNIYSFSIGAIACNIFSLVSIFVGMARFDKQKKE